MVQMLMNRSTLEEWQRILENDKAESAAFKVGEAIYDELTKAAVKSQVDKKPTVDKGGLIFKQLMIDKMYRIRPDDTIKPAAIRGILVKVVEKRRTKITVVLQEDAGDYKTGARFNASPSILQEV